MLSVTKAVRPPAELAPSNGLLQLRGMRFLPTMQSQLRCMQTRGTLSIPCLDLQDITLQTLLSNPAAFSECCVLSPALLALCLRQKRSFFRPSADFRRARRLYKSDRSDHSSYPSSEADPQLSTAQQRPCEAAELSIWQQQQQSLCIKFM